MLINYISLCFREERKKEGPGMDGSEAHRKSAWECVYKYYRIEYVPSRSEKARRCYYAEPILMQELYTSYQTIPLCQLFILDIALAHLYSV